MPPRTRSVAAASCAASRASQLTAAADALTSNEDCWLLVGEAILRTHNLQVYASWRLASKACLGAWQHSFDATAPWLSIWPANLERYLWQASVPHFDGESGGGPGCHSFDHGEGMGREWRRLANRFNERFGRAWSLKRRSANARLSNSLTFTLADFRLHIAVEEDGKLIFVGSAGGYPTSAPDPDDDDVAYAFQTRNLVDVYDSGGGRPAAMLADESLVATAGRGVAQLYYLRSEELKVTAMISRSDGALVCVAKNVHCGGDDDEAALGFLLGEGSDDGEDSDVEGDTETPFSCIRLNLDEVEYDPHHPAWDERARPNYNDDDSERDPSDDERDPTEEIAVVPDTACLCFRNDVSDYALVSALMKLPWV